MLNLCLSKGDVFFYFTARCEELTLNDVEYCFEEKAGLTTMKNGTRESLGLLPFESSYNTIVKSMCS